MPRIFTISIWSLARCAVLALVALGSCPAGAVVVSTPLTLSPADANDNRLQFDVTAFGFSDADTSDVSGTVGSQLDLTLTPEGAEVDGIRFTGGQIEATDMDFAFVFIVTVASIEGRGIGGDLVTTSPGFSPVVAGEFPTEDHTLLIDQGTLDVQSTVAGDFFFDLAGDPVDLTQQGVATIALTETAANANRRTYLATLMLPVDATEEIDEDGVTATIDVLGNLLATGSFTVDLPLAGDFNDDGRVDAVDYAVWREGAALPGDYQLWRDHYGEAALPPLGLAAASAAPEPALAGWLAAIALAGKGRRTRQSSP